MAAFSAGLCRLRGRQARWKGGGQQAAGGNEAGMGTLKAIGITLALTLLNPHVCGCGDAGSSAALAGAAEMWFTAGVKSPSALWSALISGTRLLLPLFPVMVAAAHGGTALMMLYLAAGLLRQAQQVLLVYAAGLQYPLSFFRRPDFKTSRPSEKLGTLSVKSG